MKKLNLFLFLIFNVFFLRSQELSLAVNTEINIRDTVTINGIRHIVTIMGQDTKSPLLLFLHGGPGRSLMPFNKQITSYLHKNFLVVQWDQRETGETLKLNSSKEKITVNLLQSDALEMVKYLLKKYERQKLYLVSHSWGSVMGFNIAQKHPELLYAYVPISPMVDANKSAVLTMNMLKKWAKDTQNKTAESELSKVKLPFESEEDLFYSQKWLFIHNEVEGVEGEEFKKTFYAWMKIWYPVWKENAKTSLFKKTPEVGCPVYFFVGSGDNQTYFSVTADYYASLKAPKKKLTWFENSGHTIFNTESEKMQMTLIKEVLPETLD